MFENSNCSKLGETKEAGQPERAKESAGWKKTKSEVARKQVTRITVDYRKGCRFHFK